MLRQIYMENNNENVQNIRYRMQTLNINQPDRARGSGRGRGRGRGRGYSRQGYSYIHKGNVYIYNNPFHPK